jgi:hypothetical protein
MLLGSAIHCLPLTAFQHPFVAGVDASAQDDVMNLVNYCWATRTELF